MKEIKIRIQIDENGKIAHAVQTNFDMPIIEKIFVLMGALQHVQNRESAKIQLSRKKDFQIDKDGKIKKL